MRSVSETTSIVNLAKAKSARCRAELERFIFTWFLQSEIFVSPGAISVILFKESNDLKLLLLRLRACICQDNVHRYTLTTHCSLILPIFTNLGDVLLNNAQNFLHCVVAVDHEAEPFSVEI